MKKIVIICLAALTLGGCGTAYYQKKVVGRYQSFARMLGAPMLNVQFYKDSTFTYFTDEWDPWLRGRWEVNKDTVFLYAKEFEQDVISEKELWEMIIANPGGEYPDVICHNGQFTYMKHKDAYKIEGRRLYVLPIVDSAKRYRYLSKFRD